MRFIDLALLLQLQKELKEEQNQPVVPPSRPFDPEDTPTPTPVLNPPKPQKALYAMLRTWEHN